MIANGFRGWRTYKSFNMMDGGHQVYFKLRISALNPFCWRLRMENILKKLQIICFCALLILLGTLSARAENSREMPSWIKHHYEYIEKTGDALWKKWVKELSAPEAIALGKAWREYLGYDAPALIAASGVAPKIQPGVVINENNYQDFPGLKDVFPTEAIARLKKGSYAQIPELRIVPVAHYYRSPGLLKHTKEKEGKVKLNEKGDLSNWIGGIPFPFPKNAAEMAHNLDRLTLGADSFWYNPTIAIIFGMNGKKERHQNAQLWIKNYTGRCDVEPIPVIPGYEGVYEKHALLFTSPFDVKGFIGARTRFADSAKEDEFMVYLPALRRIRRMAGSNTQDPVIGTDILWDDWKCFAQKLSSKVWDLDYKSLGEQIILGPARTNRTDSIRLEGNKLYMLWEKRPSWVFEIYTKNYVYAKRRIFFDKETFKMNYIQCYDARGRFYKDIFTPEKFEPNKGLYGWWNYDTVDFINRHRTLMPTKPICNPILKDEIFSLRFLSKMSH